MTVQPIVRPDARQAFAEQMLMNLNGAAISMMVSLGHRTGLFDTLSELPPSTSQQIADQAGLQERYVREWLAAMVTGGIVDYDAERSTYELPAERASSLVRAAGAENLAPLAQLLSGITRIEDHLVESFRQGGGVRFTQFPHIDEIIAETTGTKLETILDPLVHLVPSLVERLNAGIEVLDVGCGLGKATMMLAQRFPRSRFLGVDASARAVEVARREAAALGLENIHFELRDAAELDERDRFGLVVTFDAVHDQSDPAAVLQNIHRALRNGGVYIMVEPDASTHLHENVGQPLATIFYTISCFHCMTVSLAHEGAGLGAMWGRERATAMLETVGFPTPRIERIEGDPVNAYFITTKAPARA